MSSSGKVVTQFTANFNQFVKDFEHMDIQMNEVTHTVAQVASTNQEMNLSIERIALLSSQVQNRMVTMNDQEIGKASWRERMCQYVFISVVAVSLKKQNKKQ